ncbi:MAG: hypothetical protein WBX25_15635 [Rhodomicrobium sp.]
MGNGAGLAEGASSNPFEPIRDAFRFDIPPAALERLSGLANIPAHYRPTFANSMIELFAKAHRWHRMASRSVGMNEVANELDRVAKAARKLKKNVDALSKQARLTLGLYALRLEQFGEANSPETSRNQIEDLLNRESIELAVQKVDHLSAVVGRIGSASATETWPKRQKGNPASRRKDNNRTTPYVETFNRFVLELGDVVRACNGALRLEQDNIGDDVKAFFEAASPYLPNEFIPTDVFHAAQDRGRAKGPRLKMLTSLWSQQLLSFQRNLPNRRK